MGIWSRLSGALRALRGKSVGEKVWARLLSGFGAFGLPGSWSADRREQVLHWKGWPYIAGKLIAEEIAGLVPQVGYVRAPEEYEEKLGKSLRKAHPSRHRQVEQALRRKFVRGDRLRKSMAIIAPHEDLELADSDHRLVRLLRNPNGWDTGWTFWYRTLMYLELTGSAYWWVLPDGYDLPCEAWVLPSQWVWPSARREPDEIVSEYEIRPYGTPGGAGAFRIPADEIIQTSYPHPLTLWDGFAPSSAMGAWIDVLESMDAAQWTSFKNQIAPDAVIEFDASVEDPEDPQINRLKARLAERHQGERNFKVPLILSPGAKLTYPRGVAPYEMDYANSGDQKRDWILAGSGISKFMAGISDDVNRATALAALANFVRKVIRPKLLLLDGVLTERLAKKLDDRLVVYHDDPTPDDPEELRARYLLGQQLRAVTPNEYRVNVLGLEPFPHGGDDPIGAATDVPLPLNTGDQGEADDLAAILGKLKEAEKPPTADDPGTNGAPAANGAGPPIPNNLAKRFSLNGKNGHHKAPPDPPPEPPPPDPMLVAFREALETVGEAVSATGGQAETFQRQAAEQAEAHAAAMREQAAVHAEALREQTATLTDAMKEQVAGQAAALREQAVALVQAAGGTRRKTVERDASGNITAVVEGPAEGAE